MDFCISADQLRKALADIEAAEANGFMHCLSVFRMSSVGRMLSSCQAEYSDMIERAHPYDGSLDWGRFQGVSRNNRFVDGRLVRIADRESASAERSEK